MLLTTVLFLICRIRSQRRWWSCLPHTWRWKTTTWIPPRRCAATWLASARGPRRWPTSTGLTGRFSHWRWVNGGRLYWSFPLRQRTRSLRESVINGYDMQMRKSWTHSSALSGNTGTNRRLWPIRSKVGSLNFDDNDIDTELKDDLATLHQC